MKLLFEGEGQVSAGYWPQLVPGAFSCRLMGTITALPHFIQTGREKRVLRRKDRKMRSRNSVRLQQKEQIANSEHLSLPCE